MDEQNTNSQKQEQQLLERVTSLSIEDALFAAEEFGEDIKSSSGSSTISPSGILNFDPLAQPNQEAQLFNIGLEDVSYQAKVLSSTNGRKEQTIETLWTLVKGIFRCRRKADKIALLSEITTVFPPKSSTLIIGPSGSGKSLLMKLISQRLTNWRSRMKGKITFAGVNVHDIKNPGKLCTYIAQKDLHNPFVTVTDVFSFANECKTLRAGSSSRVKRIINSLLLNNCAKTIIGNEILRGVSGGERKRVTIGEMLFNNAPILLFDEISNGLDSFTTQKIVERICKDVRKGNFLAIFALLQPSPEVFDLFDELLLLSDGKVFYHGPANEALSYFKQLGYICPHDREVAEFFTDLTTPVRIKYSKHKGMDTSLDSLVAAWKASQLCLDRLNMLHTYKANQELDQYIFEKKHFQRTRIQEIKILFRKQLKMLYAEKLFYIGLLIGMAGTTVFIGLIYINSSLTYTSALETEWYIHRVSSFTGSLVITFVSAFASTPLIYLSKEIYYKQQGAGFYRTSSFLLVSLVVDIIPKIAEAFLITISVFFMVPLVDLTKDDTLEVYSYFYASVFAISLLNLQFCRVVAYITPGLAEGTILIVSCFAMGFLFNGFNPAEKLANDALKWSYYLNPYGSISKGMYLLLLRSDSFEQSAFIAFEAMQARTEEYWTWAGFVHCTIYLCLFLFLQFIFLEYVRPTVIPRKRASHEEEQEFDQLISLQNTTEIGKREMPFAPITLTFQNLSYTIKYKRKKKKLLSSIYGYAEPGTLTALMGSTGAGKSTLLDVLSNRKSTGVIEGQIMCNGKSVNVNRMIGYVEQTDIHSPNMTVREAIAFSAELRLTRTMEEKKVYIEETIKVLRLEDVAGIQIKHLNQNEAKRTTIAVEIVSNPSICYLDEPTTSLNSQDAEIVMTAIKNIALQGRTVICTIHQPSSSIFERFDMILLLKKGGNLVYFGSMRNISQYFDKFGGKRYDSQNTADMMLEVVEANQSTNLDLMDEFEKSSISLEAKKVIKKLNESTSSLPVVQTDEILLKSREKWLILYHRWRSVYWRGAFNLARLVACFVIALLNGVLYLDQGIPTSVGEINGLLYGYYYQLFFIGLLFAIAPLPTAFIERKVFYREKHNKMYPVAAYAFGVLLTEVFYCFLGALILWNIFYITLGFQSNVSSYFIGLFLSFGYLTANMFLAHIFASILPSLPLAAIAIALFDIVGIYFCGIYISLDRLANYLSWINWVFPLYYAVNGFAASQMFCDSCIVDSGVNITCNGGFACDQVCEAGNSGCNIIGLPTGVPGVKAYFTVWTYVKGAFAYPNYTYEMLAGLFGLSLLNSVLLLLSLKYITVEKR